MNRDFGTENVLAFGRDTWGLVADYPKGFGLFGVLAERTWVKLWTGYEIFYLVGFVPYEDGKHFLGVIFVFFCK